ncbi:MAG: AGE family epimerase/isomerase [Planctomycetes bacterium]|nr:AGE family epimerase/isomerase [Planctomycetota bacterium]
MAPLSDRQFAQSARRELLEDILPFWRRLTIDERRGGFIGQMSNDLRVQEDAPKGLILNARILWTFSAAWAYTRDERDRALARRAYEYLARHFLDPQHGGYFWELAPDSAVRDDKKKVYGEAFCLYALAEHHRVFREPRALEQAARVFDLLEAHAHDEQYGGYFEVMSRDWQPCADMRLSDKDMNEKKSMNNHLHVLEGYTNLLRVWPQPRLAARLRELIDLFLRHILNAPQTHLQHFFDEAWTPRSDNYTFGHDIEGSWLLCEAAEVLGDEALLADVRAVASRLARSVLTEGLAADGGLFYEGRDGRIVNPNKEWWPQAEAVVGFLNAWQLTGEDDFREAAGRCWQFIQQRVVDHQHGEWFWSIRPDGTPDPAQPKVSAWKCPYHNGRCCLEIMRICDS